MALDRSESSSPAATAAHPLDNVIWRALTTRQKGFARVEGNARKFIDDVGPLAAFADKDVKDYDALARLAAKGTVVALFLDAAWQPRAGWKLVAEAPLTQMVREKRGAQMPSRPGQRIETLGAPQSPEMQELAALVRPGPFGPRTHELGDYVGIRDEAGKLVAMAGERMKVPGFTEISAVCTHPAHTGKGYAAALIMKVVAGIEARGETAFLHSRADNDRAIALYERLGFRPRWSGYFAALLPDG
jgi:ribosomal protein S18 acetylase RimI-like enzyme